jgi:AcrR family transcriptional regulator
VTKTSSSRAHRDRAARTKPDVRRRQLLDLAEVLLERGGSDALRMDTLATAAGVTRPVVYSHFDNRDALIIALLERHEARLTLDDDGSGEPEEFEPMIRRATVSYLQLSMKHGPAMRALIAGVNLSPRIEETRRCIWDKGVDKWAAKYRRFFDLSTKDSRALATSHLTGLSAMSGMCIAGGLSVTRATELHVTSVVATLSAVAKPRRSE